MADLCSAAADRGRVRVESGLQALLASGLSLPLLSDDGRGLAEELAERLGTAIASRHIDAGTRLPSTRALATMAGVSRNVVLAAYAALAERGLVDGRHGGGTFVRHVAGHPRQARPVPRRAPAWLVELEHPGGAGGGGSGLDVRLRLRPAAVLPAVAWRRAWQSAAIRRIQGGYGDPAGERRLRAALADYLATHRGVLAVPGDVVVTSGAAEALRLLIRLVVRPGQCIAVEDPGYPSLLQIARDRDAVVVPVPVDGDGIDVAALERLSPAPRLVHVTPAHQFPTTALLAQDRRQRLLAWAQRADVLVVENDYGGEFAEAPGQAALAASDQAGVVAYVGTLSRLLAPALRTGYLVAPRPLAAAVAQHRGSTDSYLSLPVQQAVAELLSAGELTRQLRRARRAVAEQRLQLRAELPASVPLLGLHGGLHVLIPMADVERERRAAAVLRDHAVIVDRLSAYRSGLVGPAGLLVDYAGLNRQALSLVTATLRAALGAAGQSS